MPEPANLGSREDADRTHAWGRRGWEHAQRLHDAGQELALKARAQMHGQAHTGEVLLAIELWEEATKDA